MSLFNTPEAPKEDPAIAAARQREEQRSENKLISNIQEDLRRRTRLRLARFGLAPGTADYTAIPSTGAPFQQPGAQAGVSRFGYR